MEHFNYDSYCGIYCGACDIMMTYKTGCQYRLASFWNEAMVKTLHRGYSMAFRTGEQVEMSKLHYKFFMVYIKMYELWQRSERIHF